MVYFKENYNLSRLQGVTTFSRGPTFSRGGGGLLSMETYRACDFPGESRPPVSPSGTAHDSHPPTAFKEHVQCTR